MVRRMVGCHLVVVRDVDLTAPDLEAEFRRVTTSRMGRTEFKSATDEQIRQWAADPKTSLAPRPEFRPVQVKDLEFAETTANYRYINPTGGIGLVSKEVSALDLRGRVFALTDAGGVVEARFSGQLIFDRGNWSFNGLTVTLPAGEDASAAGDEK
jgi:hypothetical protein